MTQSVRATSETSITNPGRVPSELVAVDQWICWREEERDGKPTKIPVTPGTGVRLVDRPGDVDRLRDCTRVRTERRGGWTRLRVQGGDPFVGIDLDDCRDPETRSIDDDARDIVDRLDSCTEVSPSGTGFHVLIEGELPEGGNRHGSGEMYDSARFFTMAGDRVDVKPSA